MPRRKRRSNKPRSSTPFVSILTPTANRRPFMMKLIEYVAAQDYPQSRIEWCIHDDGSDPIHDLVENIPYVRYFRSDQRSPVGSKRNYLLRRAKGAVLVNMDDDDYYPPCRVRAAVDLLGQGKFAVVASSAMPMLFPTRKELYIAGPYNGGNHGTGGTIACTRAYARTHSYKSGAPLGEEKHFLEDFNAPIGQLDPFSTILVVAHTQNSFDKAQLLEGENAGYMHKQDDLSRVPAPVKDFYLNHFEAWLLKHRPRAPGVITVTAGDGQERVLSAEEAATALQEKEKMIASLRARLLDVTKKCREQSKMLSRSRAHKEDVRSTPSEDDIVASGRHL